MFIVKYNNRKMYSKALKSYVTLTDIRDMIRNGTNITVANSDGVDITSQTLTKALANVENVPVSSLTDLIQA